MPCLEARPLNSMVCFEASSSTRLRSPWSADRVEAGVPKRRPGAWDGRPRTLRVGRREGATSVRSDWEATVGGGRARRLYSDRALAGLRTMLGHSPAL